MEPHAILAWLEKDRDVFFEGYHIHSSYLGYHKRPDGTTTKVTVTVYDRGLNAAADYRYHVDAVTEEGARATGNPAESIESALAMVHWHNLDREKVAERAKRRRSRRRAPS